LPGVPGVQIRDGPAPSERRSHQCEVGPAKPRVPIKVVECGPGRWDERDHRLDYPGTLYTIDFRVTGRGHERIEALFPEWLR